MVLRRIIINRYEIAAYSLLVCALLLLSTTTYVQYKAEQKTSNRLTHAVAELAKVVELTTWDPSVMRLMAKNALKHTLDILDKSHIEITHNLLHIMRKPATEIQKPVPLDVCPEKLVTTNPDYSWFTKRHVLTDCTNGRPFQTVVSILLNGFDYTDENQIILILRDIYDAYPHLTVHLAVPEKIVIPVGLNLNILQHIFGKKQAANSIWNGLVEKATTDYVLVGRRIERFHWYALLERLVRVVSELGVDAVGGALRTPDGHWSMGCQQTRLRNYTLTYIDGYQMSTHSCAYCDYIPTPFMSRTSTLRAMQFKMASPDTVFFDYFLRLQKDRKLVMSCPDAMFYVPANNKDASSLHMQWIPMIQKYTINHVNFADGRHLSFTCEEAKTMFSWRSGIITPVCAVETLLKGTMDTMDICQKIGLFCQLDGGTTLGALKFNGILPWERDSDIGYEVSNNTNFWEHRDEFSKLGYTLALKYPEKCREFDPHNPGCHIYNLYIPHWRLEVWTTPRLMADYLLENRIASTKLLLGGRWFHAPTNPGLNSRNRLGFEMLRHAEHWITLDYSTSWIPYHPELFINCPEPGSNICLDQYRTDGNMDFTHQ